MLMSPPEPLKFQMMLSGLIAPMFIVAPLKFGMSCLMVVGEVN
jgi:hypothetical protein